MRAGISEENTASIRFIRVVDDAWTVEVELEASNLSSLIMMLMNDPVGRRFLSLFFKSIENVKPYGEEENEPEPGAEEEAKEEAP